MLPNPIARLASSDEYEKVRRIIERCDMTPFEEVPATVMVLSVDNEETEEHTPRLIVGTVSVTSDGRVCFFAITKKYRGRGLGRFLFKSMLDNYPHARLLHVKWNNWRAIRIYLSFGFIPVGFRGTSLTMRRVTIKLNGEFTDMKYIPIFRRYHGKKERILPKKLDFDKLYQVKLTKRLNYGKFANFNYYRGEPGAQAEVQRCFALLRNFDYSTHWGNPETVQEGEYKGSWVKRFGKYYFKAYEEKCPQDLLVALGNHIHQVIGGAEDTVCFKIVRSVDWVSGDFGDDGSCLFDNQENTDDWDEDLDEPVPNPDYGTFMYGDALDGKIMFAVKLYAGKKQAERSPECGIGRCWLYRINDQTLVASNAYGDVEVPNIAEAIARVIGYETYPVRLRNTPVYNNDYNFAIVPEFTDNLKETIHVPRN